MYVRTHNPWISSFASMVFLAMLAAPTFAQRTSSQPVTDSAAQASPLSGKTNSPVNDGSMQASPITAVRSGGAYIEPHTEIPISLAEGIDSGWLKQGQSVKAHLTAPVRVHGGPTLPAGTTVELSVIASVPAGRIMAQGEFSLQVLRVGNVGVYTNTLVFDGRPGHQDLPDSAPQLGTDAGLPNGASLSFRVSPFPSDDVDLHPDWDTAPGAVNGTAIGGTPPASQAKSTYGDPSSPNSGRPQNFVSPANTTTNQQIQHLGQASPAPNQPQSPANGTPRQIN